MQKYRRSSTHTALLMSVPLACLVSLSSAQTRQVLTGAAAFGGWKSDAPGVSRQIKLSDVPPPVAGRDPEGSIADIAKVVDPPKAVLPKVPSGFAVEVFATGLKQPRNLRVAPNGDVFLAESGTGRVLVFRVNASGPSAKPEVFAEKLDRP